ncbi:hypothetical protein BJ508DRAFT_333077 [Ascobolus immersus RN42]|uniref:Uncharacterized protein n=1 Tax=Ascobolus immersus RN42 TaxID=1160509 RepID=A0A3N4HQU9_ASCIM|nr:hypothetical protein BJ508DRAFT_333077 [Ascobolus immersus RN42]
MPSNSFLLSENSQTAPVEFIEMLASEDYITILLATPSEGVHRQLESVWDRLPRKTRGRFCRILDLEHLRADLVRNLQTAGSGDAEGPRRQELGWAIRVTDKKLKRLKRFCFMALVRMRRAEIRGENRQYELPQGVVVEDIVD